MIVLVRCFPSGVTKSTAPRTLILPKNVTWCWQFVASAPVEVIVIWSLESAHAPLTRCPSPVAISLYEFVMLLTFPNSFVCKATPCHTLSWGPRVATEYSVIWGRSLVRACPWPPTVAQFELNGARMILALDTRTAIENSLVFIFQDWGSGLARRRFHRQGCATPRKQGSALPETRPHNVSARICRNWPAAA